MVQLAALLALLVATSPDPAPASVPVHETDLPGSWLAPRLPSASALQGYRQSLPPGYAEPRASSRHVFILMGARNLENGDWSGLDEQFLLALTADQRIDPARVSLDIGFYGSGTNGDVQGVSAKNYVYELDLGLFKMLEPKAPIRPYVGAGVAFVWVTAQTTGATFVDDRDFSLGGYGRAGIAYRFGYGGLIGLDFHYLGGTSISIDGLSTDVDGWSAAVSFGYGF